MCEIIYQSEDVLSFAIATVDAFGMWNRHKLSTRHMIHPLHVCQGLLILKPFDPWMSQLMWPRYAAIEEKSQR